MYLYICTRRTLLANEVLGHVAQELVARRDEGHLPEEVPREQQLQHCVAHLHVWGLVSGFRALIQKNTCPCFVLEADLVWFEDPVAEGWLPA